MIYLFAHPLAHPQCFNLETKCSVFRFESAKIHDRGVDAAFMDRVNLPQGVCPTQ
jgi:hypothetical protein